MTSKINLPNISIIGCGWIGLPLAINLKKQGYNVSGTTTSQEKINILQNEAITPIHLTCHTDGRIQTTTESIFDANILIVTIPFKRSLSDPMHYYNQLHAILERYKKSSTLNKWILFTSSISVYSATNQTVDETTIIKPKNPRQQWLLQTENTLLNSIIPTTVVRLGGLVGYDRKIGNFFTRKTLTTPNHPTNLIHRDDVIGIITTIIKQQEKNTIFNAVCPHHPQKKDLYTFHSKLQQQPPPTIDSTQPSSYKLVSGNKIIKQLKYTFKYDNLMCNL